MNKPSALSELKLDNQFTVNLFEGRLEVTFEPNSMLKRIQARKHAQEMRELLKQHETYQQVFAEIDNFIDYFCLIGTTFVRCEVHLQGDEQPGFIWFAERLQRWQELTQLERWQVRMESDVHYWDVLFDGFLDQKIKGIPIESRPAELLTEHERAEALDPKAQSVVSDGNGNVVNSPSEPNTPK